MLSLRPLLALAALFCLCTPGHARGEYDSPEEAAYVAEKDRNIVLGISDLTGAPLQLAARDGNAKQLTQVLNDGVDVNHLTDGVSALWIACALGREKVVDILLEWEADVDLPGPDGLTPLLAASENGYDEIILKLLEEGADIEAKNKKGSTALILGTLGVHPRVVKILSENHANVEAETDSGVTPLLLAAYIGDLYIVKTLLSAGADVENADSNGATPLFVAAQGGHELVVHELLQAGGNPSIPRVDGSTPLHAAAAGCHLAVVELLLEAEANPVFMDIFGQKPADYIQREICADDHVLYAIEAILRPLFYASQEGNAWVVSTLLENGGDVNSLLMSNERTPLHLASAHSREEVVRVLVEAGADINSRDVTGARPIDILGSERPPGPAEAESITRMLLEGAVVYPPSNPEISGGTLKPPPPGREMDENTFSTLSFFVLLGIGIAIGLVFACIGGSVLAHIYRNRCKKECPELYAKCSPCSASSKQVSSSARRGSSIQASPYHNPNFRNKMHDPTLRRQGDDQIVTIGYSEHMGGSRRSHGHSSSGSDRYSGILRGDKFHYPESHRSRSSAGTHVPRISMLENALDRDSIT